MRRRQSITAVAAVSALAAGAIAATSIANAADNDDQTSPDIDSAAGEVVAGTVILPTGDRVTVAPNGTTGLQRAEGREDAHFLALNAPDGSGDTIVVPSDQVEAIRSGEDDARRYNVSQLIRDGHTDAAAVPESELDDRSYDGLLPAADTAETEADTQPVTVTIADRAGEVPDNNFVGWYNAATGEEEFFSFDETGTGTEELPAGEYLIFGEVWNEDAEGASTEIVMGVTAVHVGDEPVETAFAGTDASPLTVDVEQPDAEFDSAVVALGFQGATDVEGTGSGILDFPGAETDTYVLPEPEMPEGPVLDFVYQPSLSSPEGAADPYRYHLAFGEIGGYPDDLAFSVTDAELSVEETTYNGFGTGLSGNTCDTGDPTGSINAGWCMVTPADVPSTRTDYRSAGDVVWTGFTEFGTFDDEGFMLLDGFTEIYDDRTLEAGEATVTRGHGPFGAGAPDMAVTGGETAAATAFLYPAAGYNDETVNLVGYDGTAVLSLDGEELGRFEGADTYPVVDAELPGAGRYTLTSETTRGTDTVPFGTANTQRWSFDLDPTELDDGDGMSPSIPVVALTTDGVDGGYADATEPLELTLSLASSAWTEPTTAQAMTFEVSYDDGATWTEVPLELEDGTAAATLEHPEGAEYVSVRTTATDDAGTEVESTTIRAFGLQ